MVCKTVGSGQGESRQLVGDKQEYTPPVSEDYLYLSQGRAERAAPGGTDRVCGIDGELTPERRC